MPLPAGTRLGPYEILGAIGAGGMGEVYRARDTRLGRDVAIKTSKLAFDDRFQREARAIAALNHPNICTLYDVGPDYLVMEYVDGQTLNDRIRRGRLPEADALAIAMQVASALEAAHDKGIVHRDLKPGNIKIKPDGQVKVLDFGLAKILADDVAAANPQDSPTMTEIGTARGVILGTAAYMAPEQARSQTVDKRADIWAFGVVLWEMLTGRRPFLGDTASDSIAAVLKEEPPWNQISPRVRPLLRRCLEKDPRKRLHDIADARLWLDEPPGGAPTVPMAPWRIVRLTLAAGLASFLGAAILLSVVWFGRNAAVADPSIQFALDAPVGTKLDVLLPVAISPDGRRIVYGTNSAAGENILFLHTFTSGSNQLLKGTFGATWVMWSPDNKEIAFASGGKLKRLLVDGGSPREVTEAPVTRIPGGAWGPQFFMLVRGDRLVRVPLDGGPAQEITKLNAARGETAFAYPQLLPDRKHFLVVIDNTDPRLRSLYRGSLEDPSERQQIVSTDKGLYAPAVDGQPESVLYVREQKLLARPFDSSTGNWLGDESVITEGIGHALLWADFWISEARVLAYRASNAVDQKRLMWWKRDTRQMSPALSGTRPYASFFLSPDENQLTVDITNATDGRYDVWIYDFGRPLLRPLIATPAQEFLAVWEPKPDTPRLVYGSSRSGPSQLYLTRPGDVADDPKPLADSPQAEYPLQWATNGWVLFRRWREAGGFELWGLPIDGDRKEFPIIQSSSLSIFSAQMSPNGKWIAFQATSDQGSEVYVQPNPLDGGSRIRVSVAGGRSPKWNAKGSELFYISGNDSLVAVPMTPTANGLLVPGTEEELFHGFFPIEVTYPYDVTRDGKRFLVLDPVGQQDLPLQVVTHWQLRMKK
jgi:Tol biopolymer transport system component/predicted Ser/Thr protein kinase